MNPLIQFRTTTLPLLIALVLACFAISPMAQAVVPAPDGGYPGGNTAEGQNALLSRTTGGFNTALGWLSLRALTTGSFNTGVGAGTLVLNTGDSNTAVGTGALLLNTTGGQNTANGSFALLHNTEGSGNTANGFQALFNNTTGVDNTANGANALVSNTIGNSNTANGFNALSSNDAGELNTAVGTQALYNNTAGGQNTAVGTQALFNNTTAGQNTAIGSGALFNNIAGINNTAVGLSALGNTTGQGNIGVGAFAGNNLTTGDFNIDIFATGVAGESNTIRIGGLTQTATYITGISGAVVPGGVTVIVDADGHLGTAVSSQRFKDGIKAMDKASEAILALKPVTFRYKHELDPKGIPQFGLVAEDVAQVHPDLVARDAKGEVYTVRYEAVNAMLLNEFLKEHCKVEKLEATVTKQQNQIEALTAGLQKVSAQVEMNRIAPQMVVNNQ